MASHIVVHARRFVFGGASGLLAFASYKSQSDPVHIFWDLDHTILCSISPIPDNQDSEGNSDIPKQNNNSSKCPVAPSNLVSLLLPPPPKLHHFDQIDDDFPYDDKTLAPNTRTYFHPGALLALKLCTPATLHLCFSESLNLCTSASLNPCTTYTLHLHLHHLCTTTAS